MTPERGIALGLALTLLGALMFALATRGRGRRR